MVEEETINVLAHVLVPKHEILNEEEIKKLMEKYGIMQEQLPKILANDPAVKAIGAKAGDVIKITRDSQTAGKTEYFRTVVKR
jgi:DNA-directed RNA polymerase subunit H